MIRLYIIEDHAVIIDGIRQRIRHHAGLFTLAGTAHHVVDFLTTADPAGFDLVVLDLWLPESDPVDNLKSIRQRFPDKPVVIFTQETSRYWINIMMNNGAAAYMLKSMTSQEFKEALEKASRGMTFSPPLPAANPSTGTEAQPPSSPCLLKPAEKAILTLLAGGSTIKAIAKERGTTVSAIEKTLKKTRTAFKVRTNPELVKVLMTLRIIR